MFSFPVMQLTYRILAYIKKKYKVTILLGIYQKEIKVGHRDICTSMFIMDT